MNLVFSIGKFNLINRDFGVKYKFNWENGVPNVGEFLDPETKNWDKAFNEKINIQSLKEKLIPRNILKATDMSNVSTSDVKLLNKY